MEELCRGLWTPRCRVGEGLGVARDRSLRTHMAHTLRQLPGDRRFLPGLCLAELGSCTAERMHLGLRLFAGARA